MAAGVLFSGWFVHKKKSPSYRDTIVNSLVINTPLEALSFSTLKQMGYSGEIDLICRADIESSELEMIFEKHTAINRLHGDSFDRILRRSTNFISIGGNDADSVKCYNGLLKPGVWIEVVIVGDENVVFFSRM